jgi:hypothetical protein
LKWKVELTNCVRVDSEGSRGGLALFWKKDIDVRIKS